MNIIFNKDKEVRKEFYNSVEQEQRKFFSTDNPLFP